MMRDIRLFTILLFISYSVSLQGQESLSAFKYLVDRTIAHNKNLQNELLLNDKVAWDREEVRGKLLPTLSFQTLYGYVNTGTKLDIPTQALPITGLDLFEGATKGNFSSQLGAVALSATQVVFSGMQITNGQKALEHKHRAQQLLIEAQFDVLAYDMIVTLDQLMLLKEVDVLIEDSQKRLEKEHLKVIKAIENGFSIPYDREKIKLAMLELESRRAEIQSSRELLYYKLEDMTGMPLDSLQQIDFPLERILLSGDGMTLMLRKEVDALEESQEAYNYLLKKEKGGLLPKVFVFGTASYFSVFNTQTNIYELPIVGDLKLKANAFQLTPMLAVGAALRWNIFEGNTHRVNIERAKIDIQMNANKLHDTREKLTLQQRKALADYNLALKKVLVNEQAMTIAANTLNLATRRFEAGLMDVTERLQAENEYYTQSLHYYTQIVTQRSAAVELLKVNGNLFNSITNQ